MRAAQLARALVALVVVTTSAVGQATHSKAAHAATCAAPAVSSVYPNWGGVFNVPSETVTIKGCGFTGATDVAFHGGYPLVSFTVVDDSTITTQPPPYAYAPGSLRQGLEAVKDVTVTTPGCVSAALAASPLSPSNPGTAVTLTANASCAGPPTYRFWMRPPGGIWRIVQDYSTTSTYPWNTTGLADGPAIARSDRRDRDDDRHDRRLRQPGVSLLDQRALSVIRLEQSHHPQMEDGPGLRIVQHF